MRRLAMLLPAALLAWAAGPDGNPLHLRLTAVFANLPGSGSAIETLFSFDTGDLRWSIGPDGVHQATIELIAGADGKDGLAIAPIHRPFRLQFNARDFAEAVKAGIVCGINLPVSKPGAYTVHAALRDSAGGATGSAEQSVDAPDFSSGRLALSGVVLQEATYAALYTAVPFTQANADLPQFPAPRPDVTGGAARRSFQRGTLLAYGFKILNPTSGVSQAPQLEVRTLLYHDGAQLMDGKTALDPAGAGSAPDPQRLLTGGQLVLGRGMQPGRYQLQVVVTDGLAPSGANTATQSMDFEIEPQAPSPW